MRSPQKYPAKRKVSRSLFAFFLITVMVSGAFVSLISVAQQNGSLKTVNPFSLPGGGTGGTSTDSGSVSLSQSPSGSAFYVGTTISWSASHSFSDSDSDGDSFGSYYWEGAGAPSAGSSTGTSSWSYTYNSAGSNFASVWSDDTDSDWASSTVEHQFTIYNHMTSSAISISSSRTTVDAGESFSAKASISSDYGISNQYQFNFGDGTGWTSWSSSNSASHTYSSQGTYTITVNVKDSSGSEGSASMTEHVSPALSASPTFSPGYTDTGQNVQFTANPSGGSGSGYVSWYWYINGNQFSTSENPTTSFSSSYTSGATITMKFSDSNGMTVTETATTSSNSNNLLYIYNPPTASIKSSSNPASPGNTITFSVVSPSGGYLSSGSNYQYSWQFGDGTVGTSYSTATSVTHSYSKSGDYQVNLTIKDTAGGTSTSTFNEAIGTAVTVSANSNVGETDYGGTVQLSAQAAGGAPADAPKTIPSGVVAWTSIPMTNNGGATTPNPFTDTLTIDSSTYSSYEASNLHNVEFFLSDGTVLNSWIGSGNSNTATATQYGVEIPSALGSGASMYIYMGFTSTSTNLITTSGKQESFSSAPASQSSQNYSYNGISGTLQNASLFNMGAVALALNNDTTSRHFINFPNVAVTGSNTWYSGWFYPTNDDYSRMLATSTGDQSYFETAIASGQLKVNAARSWISTGYSMPIDKWYYVAVYSTSSSFTVYVNGASVYTDSSLSPKANEHLEVGSQTAASTNAGNQFFGYAADIRVSSSSLQTPDSFSAGGSVTPNPLSYSYSWSASDPSGNGGSFSSTTVQNPSYSVHSSSSTATENYKFSVTAQDNIGGSGSNYVNVAVHPDPTVSLSTNIPLSQDSPTGMPETDVGVPVVFTATPNYGVSPYTYQWKLGSTTLSVPNTNTSITEKFSNSGNYTVTVILTDLVGMTYSASQTVHVNPDLQAYITKDYQVSDVQQSVSYAIHYSYGTTLTAPITNWYIDGATSPTASGATFSHPFQSAGVHEVKAVVSDQIGPNAVVYSNQTVMKDMVTSIQSSQPTTDVGNTVTFEIPGTASYLINSSSNPFSLNNAIYNSTAGYLQATNTTSGHLWYGPYTSLAPGQYQVDFLIASSVGVTGSTSIDVTAHNGSVTLGQKTINLANYPAQGGFYDVGIPINVTSSSDNFIEFRGGQEANFFTGTFYFGGVAVVPYQQGAMPYSYQWSVGGVIVSSQAVMQYTFNNAGQTNVMLTLTDKANQSVSASPYTEYINIDPAVSISSSQPTADVGNHVYFNSTVSAGTAPYKYQWYQGGSKIQGATNADYNTSFSSSGTYKIKEVVTDSNGNTATSNTISEVVNSALTSYITSSQNATDVGNQVTFTAHTSGGTPSYSYAWTVDGSLQSSQVDYLQTSIATSGIHYVNVTVTDSTNQHNTYSTSFKEYVNVDPSASISVNPSPTDVNVASTFTGTAYNGTGPYNYTWTIDGQTLYGQVVHYTFSVAGTYTVLLKIQDVNGNHYSTTYDLVVNPSISASISSRYTSIDQGINDIFTAEVTGGTGPYSYLWTIGGVTVGIGQTLSYNASASYTLVLTITDNLSQSNSASVPITVNQPPKVIVNGPTGNTDVGVTNTYIASPSNGTGQYTYKWYVQSSLISTGPVFQYSFDQASGSGLTWKLTMSAEDQGGGYYNQTFTVVVNSTATGSITPEYRTIDSGMSDQFTSQFTSGTQPYSYNWYVNGKLVGSQSSPTYTLTSSGINSVMVVMTDGVGHRTTEYSNITVNSLPYASFTPRYSIIDVGVNDYFNGTASLGIAPYNYTWYVNNVIVGYGKTLNYSFTATGTSVVKLTVTDNFHKQVSYDHSVTVIEAPTAYASSNVAYTDINSQISFSGNAKNGSAPFNFTWSVNGVDIGYGQFIQYTFSKAGTYNVILTVTDAIGKVSTATVPITVNPHLSAVIQALYNGIDVTQGDTFTAKVSNGTGPYTYEWMVGNSIVSSASSFSFYFNYVGNYTVKLMVRDSMGESYTYYTTVFVNQSLSARIIQQYTTADYQMYDSMNSSVAGGTGPFTYAWLLNGSLFTTASQFNYFYPAPATYHWTLIVNDSRGESVSYRIDIVATGNPLASINLVNSTDAGVQNKLTGTVEQGAGGYNYSWLISGNLLSGQMIYYTFNNPGNYTVQLTVSDSFGRQDTVNRDIRVFKDPVLSVSSLDKPKVSQPYSLTSTVTYGEQPTHVQWVFPTEEISGLNAQYIFNTAGQQKYQVIVSDASGYSHTYNFTVQVQLFVQTQESIASGFTPLKVYFTSSAIGGSQYLYAWNFSNGNTSIDQNPSQVFLTGNYTVRLVVTSENGARGYSNMTVQSLPSPVQFSYTATGNQTVLSTYTFTATPNWDGSGPYNVTWKFPSGKVLHGMTVNYVFPLYQKSNAVSVTFNYGNNQTDSETLYVQMYAAPLTANFKIGDIVPVGEVVNLSAIVKDPDSNQFTYTWSFNGYVYTGNDQFFSFPTPGNYTISLKVTDSLGASVTVTKTVQAEMVGNNANIVINIFKHNNGPFVDYHIQVLSSAPLDLVTAYLGTQGLDTSYSNDTNGYWYNLTLNQENYEPGTYTLKIIVFTKNGQSNSVPEPFFVSQEYGKGGSQFTLVSFFGGLPEFVLTILSLSGGIVAAVAYWRDKKDKDTEYVNIGGSVVQAKRSPEAKADFERARKDGKVVSFNSPPPKTPPMTGRIAPPVSKPYNIQKFTDAVSNFKNRFGRPPFGGSPPN